MSGRAQERRAGKHTGAYGNARVTPQRERIAAVAASLGAFTVDDLAERLHPDSPRAGLATVYRAVHALEGTGSVHKIGTRGAADLYVWCVADEHHHHVVCTSCGAVEHADCPFGDGSRLPSVAGYTISGHEMTLFGVCAACAKAERG